MFLAADIRQNSAYYRQGSWRMQTQDSATNSCMIWSTNSGSNTGATDWLVLEKTGVLRPNNNGSQNLGSSGMRWNSVYAANGSIQTSDSRGKTNITDSTLGLSFIKSLRPVSYKLKVSDSTVKVTESDVDGVPLKTETTDIAGTRTHWGLIAQEVKTAIDSAGVDFAGWCLDDKNDSNSSQALRYSEFIAPLIKAVQELSAEVETLKAKVG